MKIGLPKEIKVKENRVALTPGGVATLVRRGHVVTVEKGAGIGSGFQDLEYEVVESFGVDNNQGSPTTEDNKEPHSVDPPADEFYLARVTDEDDDVRDLQATEGGNQSHFAFSLADEAGEV